jgi:NhaP-type Na+/H+ or K+/H+ antiporter
MQPAHLRESLAFAGVVVLAVLVARLAIVIGFNRLSAWWQILHGRREPISWRLAALEGWSGMRGFVTLATAIALPASFPQRDLAVLTAFSVVLVTLVLQGPTLAPLIRVLKLDRGDALKDEVANGRSRLADAALVALENESGREAENLRDVYLIQRDSLNDPDGMGRHSAKSWSECGQSTRSALIRIFSCKRNSIGTNSHCFAMTSDGLRRVEPGRDSGSNRNPCCRVTSKDLRLKNVRAVGVCPRAGESFEKKSRGLAAQLLTRPVDGRKKRIWMIRTFDVSHSHNRHVSRNS